MPKKVIFLLYSKHPTGGLKVLFRVGNGLLERGYEVSFFIAEDASAYQLEYENHCELIHSPQKISDRLFTRLLYLYKARLTADVFIATYFPTAVAGYFNAGIRNRLIYYVQANESHFFSFRLKTLLRRFHYFLLAKLSYQLPIKKVVNCLGSTAGLNRKYSYEMIPPGIDPAIYFPVKRKNNKIKIGHISRRERRKGSIEFFEAMHSLRLESIDFDLLIAYDKCLETKGLIYSAVQPRNEMELSQFYGSCDIVVSTVWEKGFAYPPLETMACGSLSISTPIDYGAPGTDHFSIQVNNVESIKNAIKWVISNPEAAERMRENGIKTSQQFHWDRIINLWEEVLA